MCGGYRIRPRSIYRLAANAVIITDFVRSGVGCGNVEMAAVRVWRVWDPAANGPNEYVGRGLRPKHGVPEPSLRVPHAKRLPKDRDVPDVSGDPSVSFKVCRSIFRSNSDIAVIPRRSSAPMGQ